MKTELLSLTWDKIDLEGGTILIMSACKVGRDNNCIYLITWRGKPAKRIVGAFETAKRKAEIDPNRKLPPYAFVTAPLNAGGDLKGVYEMAGHSRTETTTRIYQHTNINLHRGIVESLPPISIDS